MLSDNMDAHSSTDVPANATVMLATVTTILVLLSAGVAYCVWALRRNVQARAARNRQRILFQPSRLILSEPATLELGNSFTKENSCEPEPFVFPYFRPHNLAAFLPPPPARAYVPGTAPSAPPGLPLCRILNAKKSPVVVSNPAEDHCSIKVIFGHAGPWASRSVVQAQEKSLSLIPTTVIEEHGRRENSENDRGELSLGLGLMLGDVETEIDGDLVVSTVPNEEMGATNVVEGGTIDEQDRLPHAINSTSTPPLQFPSPPPTPSLPTLVITSASINRGILGEKCILRPSLQQPSPPPTPSLVITAPSIRCGLNLVVEGSPGERDDDSENWSDVVALEEYEDEGYFTLKRKSPYIAEQLPSPPQTPKLVFTPPSSSRARPLAWCEPRLHDGKTISRTSQVDDDDEHATASDNESEYVEKPFDYIAFRVRLAAFTRAHELARAAQSLTVKVDAPIIGPVSPTPSRGAGFDYETLLARRRGASLQPSARGPVIQAPSQVRATGRPRPLHVDIQPLLLRTVDRARLRTSPSS